MAVYATPDELAEFLAPDPAPPGAARLLARASRDVDGALLCTRYAVDDTTGVATDPKTAAAIKEATLEQAAWRVANGEADGISAPAGSAAIGSVNVTRPAPGTAGSGTVGRLGEQAAEVLRLAGLTGHAPRSNPFEYEDGVEYW
ncbi:hypothetical protein [Actinomadura terrae]|uniref:hypothetical protein n=1 Tax=Actinomadura terrae TaxID=604353 RepID=UPI001FA72FF2|nr:hypothetical protein [Actinomadura terrae]